jgi:hypothetical protein
LTVQIHSLHDPWLAHLFLVFNFCNIEQVTIPGSKYRSQAVSTTPLQSTTRIGSDGFLDEYTS